MANLSTDKITELLSRYKAGETLTDAEASLLGEWLHSADGDVFLQMVGGLEAVTGVSAEGAGISAATEKALEAKLDLIDSEKEEASLHSITRVHRVHFIRRWVAAAVIIFAIAGGAWFWIASQKHAIDTTITASVFKNDVAPGKKGGILKLSDDRKFGIDTLKEGFIAMDAGMKVYKENGKIVYKGTATETVYNEIIEETGRFTMAELPDHSTAWVASNSSIRYPLQFAKDERKVTMTGQAAFKVVHNERQPFRVEADGQVFEDMGTVFNIRAYKDEGAIRTTVMEGLVRVGNTMIKPSQQAQVGKDGKIRLLDKVNLESVFAWRDGEFTYSKASIEEIMTEAARWYGIEVIYRDQIDQRFDFVGIDRNMPISNLLKNLETIGGVHFEVNGKKVTVKK